MVRRFKLRTILLLLLVLLAGTYLLRWPLFGGLIRQHAAAVIGEALGVSAEVGDLGGNLVTEIHCTAIRATAGDERSQVRSLSVDRVRARYNPLKLIAGDLAALSISAENTFLSVDLDRPGITDRSDETGPSTIVLPRSLPIVEIGLGQVDIVTRERILSAWRGSLSVGPPTGSGQQEGRLCADCIHLSTPDWDELWRGVGLDLLFERDRYRIRLSEPEPGDRRLGALLTISAGENPRAGLVIDVVQTGGSTHIDAEALLVEEISLEASVRTSGLDMERTAEELAPFVGSHLPLWGRLDGTITVAGPLIEPAALEVDVDCHVTGGGWLGTEPLDVDLSAHLGEGSLRLDHCEISGDSVALAVTGGVLPLKDWSPLFDEAAAEFSFQVRDRSALKGIIDIEKIESVELLAGAAVDGAGRLDEGVFRLEKAGFESRSASIRIEDACLDRRENRFHIEVARLEGDIDGKGITLSDPLVVDFDAGRLEVAPTRFDAGSGSVLIEGEIMPDRSARIHAALSGTDSSFLDWLLPLAGYDEPVDWEGLEATLDLSGTTDAFSGNVDLRVERFSIDRIDVDDVGFRASLTPGHFQVERLGFLLADGGRVEARIGWNLDRGALFAKPEEVEGSIEWHDLNLATLSRIIPRAGGAEGVADGSLRLEGPLSAPRADLAARFTMEKTPAAIADRLSDGIASLPWSLALEARLADGALRVSSVDFSSQIGSVAGSGRMPIQIDLSSLACDAAPGDPRGIEVEGTFERIDLAAIGMAPGLSGRVSGEFDCFGPFDFPRGELTARAEDLVFGSVVAHDLRATCRLEQGRLIVSDLDLSREGRPVARGALSVDLKNPSGRRLALPGEETSFELDFHVDGEDLAAYADLLGTGISGSASVAIEGKGTLAAPRLHVDLAVEQGVLPFQGDGSEIPVDVRARLLFGGESLAIDDLTMETLGGAYLKANGLFPLGIGWQSVGKRGLLKEDGPVKGRIESNGIDLARFNGLVPGLRRLGGLMTVDADLEGVLSAPRFTACLSLTEGVVRFESRIPSLEGIEVSLRADSSGIHIDSFDAEMGAGPVHLEGSVAFVDFAPASIDLKLRGDHVLLSRGRGLRVRGDLDLVLEGPIEHPRLSGEVALADTRFVRYIPLIPGKGPPSVDARLQPFSFTDPYLADLVFDVALVTRNEKDVVVDNNLISGELLLDMFLRGTGRDPFFQGTATFNDMFLKFPNSRFEVDAGRLSFTERDPYMPHVELSARGRRQSYDISFTAWGPLNDPEMTFATIPPLPEEEVIVLVTTGMLPESLRTKGVENEALKQVGAYLGMELYQKYFGSEATESGESIMDRIELTIGSEVGRDGTDNVVVEYRIQGPWSLQVERDIYADMNLGLVYRIRFR